jgi:hypothetical protein
VMVVFVPGDPVESVELAIHLIEQRATLAETGRWSVRGQG